MRGQAGGVRNSMCRTPSRMPVMEQAASNGSSDRDDSFAHLPPQSAPTYRTWAAGSKYSPHSRVCPSQLHQQQSERAPFRCAGLLRKEFY